MRRFDPVKMLALVSVFFAVVAACAAAGGISASPVLVLSAVSGSAPWNCNGHYYYIPCTELGSGMCKSKDGTDENTCKALGACDGCTSSDINEYCRQETGPWNALCNETPPNPTGCGKGFEDGTSVCTWNGTNKTCRCNGKAGATDCPRDTALKSEDYCNPVP